MPWPKRAFGLPPMVVRSVQPGLASSAGSHSQMSCLGTPTRPAGGTSIPPNRTARLRLLSQTMAESYRALGAATGVSLLHLPVAGSHSQVSPNALALVASTLPLIPIPARAPPKSSTLPVDFSNTMLCWPRASGGVLSLVRSVKSPLPGSHSQVSW